MVESITTQNYCGQLYMQANGISMMLELLSVFCLLDHKYVIHLAKPKYEWIRMMTLDSNSFMYIQAAM